MSHPEAQGVAAAGASPDRCDVWLISPDRRMATELLALLAREAPTMRVRQLQELPTLASDVSLAGGQFPKVCFLDASAGSRQARGWLTRLVEPPFSVPTVALLGGDDPETALRFLRNGACGCLIRPFDAEQLQPLLLRVGHHEPAPRGGGRQKVLCVVPGKGSSGATTLAANLACQAGRAGFDRVLLADMDPLAGALAFMLKLKSAYSFADALAHAEELDADLWRGLVAPYRGLDVLLSPDNPLGCETDGAGLQQVMSYAKRAYDLIILDTGGPFTALGLELARLSDEILLVLTSELGAVHGSKRTLAYLTDHGVPQSKVKVAVSRWRRGLGFDRDEIESALGGLEVISVLPNDPRAAEDAILEGRPVTSGSSFGKSLAELASQVLTQGSSAPQPRASRSVLSLFSREA